MDNSSSNRYYDGRIIKFLETSFSFATQMLGGFAKAGLVEVVFFLSLLKIFITVGLNVLWILPSGPVLSI